jgi:hypothetical protein
MADFGANPSVVAASVLHAAYTYGRFPKPFNQGLPEIRRWLNRRVSSMTEELVYRYSSLNFEETSDYVIRDLDSMPIELAYAVAMRVANALELRVAGDARHFDSAAWLRESDAQLRRWAPVLTAIGDRLGIARLVVLLNAIVGEEMHAGHGQNASVPHALQFAIEPETGTSIPLIKRNISELRPPSAPNDRKLVSDEEPSRVPIRQGPPILVDLGRIRPLHGGVVRHESDHTRIVTDSRPWAYSASLGLQDVVAATGRAAVEASLIVDHGTIGIAILERSSSVHMIAPELSASRDSEPIKLHFDVPAIEEAGDLIFRSWPTEGETTKVRILSVSVLIENNVSV